MKRPLQLLAVGLLCGLVITWVHRSPSESAPGNVEEPMSAAKEPTSAEVLAHGESERTIARIKELEEMELKQSRRDRAAEKTHSVRAQLQAYKHSAWRELIEAHRQEFEALRAEAAQSPDKRVPCTICAGKDVLDLCVVCDHTGKCPTCRGTGKYWNEVDGVDGVCPACLGSGKCFLCYGSGKMPCPFSQPLRVKEEGVITPGTPDPLTDLPID
jgi:hypothetical protein